jgi:hypothetical protein
MEIQNPELEQYKTKKCDVCGNVDQESDDFVIYGVDTGNIVKICYCCDYRNWSSTFGR